MSSLARAVDSDDAQALVLARGIIQHHSKSFALASRLLPQRAGAEAAVVYSWCRRVDDAVDLAEDTEAARAALQRERALLEEIYGETTPADPVLAAFQSVVRRHAIPAQYPLELLAGMEMDVVGVRYGSLEELLRYCFRVAGTVGLMMSHVMGVSGADALKHACHLGIGMQLTNICRDVLEDWDRGRLYLPDDLLAQAGLGDLRGRLGTPLSREAREGLAKTVQRLLERSERYYVSGERGFGALSWRSALGVRCARWIYSDIGRVLARRGHDVFAPRAVVSMPRKLILLVRALGASFLELPRRLLFPFRRAALPASVVIDDLLSL